MSDFLPPEIISDILARLTPKSLTRCRTVCKSWNSLINSSAFISLHLRRTIQSDDPNEVHALLRRNPDEFYSLYRHNPGQCTRIFYPPVVSVLYKASLSYSKFRNGYLSCSVVGTCHGLVCIAVNVREFGTVSVLIWNPSVRKYVILPKLIANEDSTCDAYWAQSLLFGYDSTTNDYKVISIASTPIKVDCYSWATGSPVRVDVYSLARGSWKTLTTTNDAAVQARCSGCKASFWDMNNSVFVNGASNWLWYAGQSVIGSFNMSTELFGEIMMLPEIGPDMCPHCLSRYRESLAFVETTIGSREEIHVWVMKEYGVVESWNKLFTTVMKDSLPQPPLVFRSSRSVHRFKLDDDEFRTRLLILNVETQQVEKFVIDEQNYSPPLEEFISVHSFVESLVLLNHTNAISY